MPTNANGPIDETHGAARDAAHWLATLSDANCSAAERQQFFEWLRSSTQNVDEFLRLSALSQRLGRAELWPQDDVATLIAEARAQSNVTALTNAGGTARRSAPVLRRRWALAAAVVIAVAATLLAIDGSVLTNWLQPVYATAIGEQRSITLDDGSVVQLNSRSRLRTQFTAQARNVELEDGEAIFRVAKDAARPFRVRAGDTQIVAVGTAFNVNANEASTVVTVLEGRVRVNRAALAVSAADAARREIDMELAGGEQLIITRVAAPVRLSLNDTDKVTAWTERRLIFEETTLDSATAEFARYSSRRIRIDDPQLAERRISGVFDATDPASLVQFLSIDPQLVVHDQGERGWVVMTRQ